MSGPKPRVPTLLNESSETDNLFDFNYGADDQSQQHIERVLVDRHVVPASFELEEDTLPTTTSISLPRADSIGKLLTGIVGKPTSAAKVSPLVLSLRTAYYVAVYHDQAGELAGLCFVDLSLAAYLSSALLMFPAATALENIKAGILTDVLRENLWEIGNIARQGLNRPDEGYLVLSKGFEIIGGLPPGLSKIISTCSGRLDTEVTVAGYGKGHMLIVQPRACKGTSENFKDAAAAVPLKCPATKSCVRE